MNPLDAPIVDAHAHTWSDAFAGDYAGAIERAWGSGLVGIVEVGGSAPSSEQARALAEVDARVHAVAGLYPHSAKELPQQREQLREQALSGSFVGIGETGLDFYRNLSAAAGAVRGVSLPARAGARGRAADRDPQPRRRRGVIRGDRGVGGAGRGGRYGAEREIGMMHCYEGDTELGVRYRKLGFLLSIPGPVTYPGAQLRQDVARTAPLESLLAETDAPALTPQSNRGSRNEPAYILETIAFVAQLRGDTPEAVARATAENAARLFGFELPS